MPELEFLQRIFGTSEDGVLYLPGALMKAAKLRPGDKLRITPEKDGFRVQKADNNPRPGGPT